MHFSAAGWVVSTLRLTSLGTPIVPYAAACALRFARTWRSAAEPGSQTVFLPAPADSGHIAHLNRLMAMASELEEKGDFSEAATIYHAIMALPISPDAAIDSVLGLVAIQVRFGLEEYSHRTLLAARHLSPDRPEAAEALADETAAHREPVVIGFRPPISTDALRLLETANRAIAAEEWERTVDLLHELMSSHRNALADVGNGLAIGVNAYARATLMGVPEPGIEACEKRFAPSAAEPMRRAEQSAEPAALISAARAFPGTVAAAHAINSAATLYLDDGRSDAAAALLAALAVSGRSTPAMLAKWSFAAERAGIPDQARRALEMLLRRFPDGSVTVSGLNRPVADYVAAQLERLTASSRCRPGTGAPRRLASAFPGNID